MVRAQFEKEMPAWESRAPQALWSGGFSGGGGRREAYAECARAHPTRVRAEVFERGSFPVLSSTQSSGPYDAKPLSADLRKLLRVKYAVYLYGNAWSSSFKRIVLSGAVVLAPRPDPFSSMESEMMAGCANCLLYFDSAPERLCSSLLAAMDSLSEEEARARAERTRIFAYAALSTERVHEFMRAALSAFPASPRGVVVGDALVLPPSTSRALLPHGGNLTRTYCSQVLVKMRAVRHGWQLDEWFDGNCRLRRGSTSYLDYVAI